jgi:integrase
MYHKWYRQVKLNLLEVAFLKWGDVDLDDGFITFKNTKNGTDRTIKLAPQLLELIKQRAENKLNPVYVFSMPNDKPVNHSWILKHRRLFQDKYPEFKKWRLHDFRHSFAWNFLRNGGEMYQLQSILGHKSIRLTVDLYGHFKSCDVKIASPYKF